MPDAGDRRGDHSRLPEARDRHLDVGVEAAAARLAPGLVVDEQADLVTWTDGSGTVVRTGLHDYAALYAVQGLYEAVYFQRLRGGSPQLLAAALAAVVPATDRAGRQVLDVGAGTGLVGSYLAACGFSAVAGTDIEPASELALRRDRPGLYGRTRSLDLTRRSVADDAWLTAVAPQIVTIAGALGFGHLPAQALAAVTGLLPPGGLLALTSAPDLASAPSLRDHAALLTGPAYVERLRTSGVHRHTAAGTALEVVALVLERTAMGA